jgi:hypothetical protein
MAAYEDFRSVYREIHHSVSFLAGSLKNHVSWGCEFSDAQSKDVQEEMIFTDFYPHLESRGFPLPCTKGMADAQDAFMRVALRKLTQFGHSFATEAKEIPSLKTSLSEQSKGK